MHIGIITCEILRKEIRDLISQPGVKDIFFVLPDDVNSVTVVPHQQVIERFAIAFADDGFALKANTLGKIEKEIRARELNDSVIIKVLELRLHDHPYDLRLEIEACIQRMGSVVDFIVLGYGLCGSTAETMEHLIEAAPVPVVVPRDRNGAILNNCIEIALGRDRVQSLLEEEVGTFFMTPAGASLVHEPQVILESTSNIFKARRRNRYAAVDTPRIVKLMKNHYFRVVKIWYSKADLTDEDYALTVKKFARRFNLEIVTVRGSTEIMCETLRTVSTTVE
jgi:hypothetical protein